MQYFSDSRVELLRHIIKLHFPFTEMFEYYIRIYVLHRILFSQYIYSSNVHLYT